MKSVIHTKYINLITLAMLAITATSGAILASSGAHAADQTNAKATITVSSTCSMTATVNTAHTATLVNGIYSGDYEVDGNSPYANGIGKTTIQTNCNDQNGYSIYAVGYTGDILGNNVLHNGAIGSSYDIVTGTATNGLNNNDTSNWAMKVTAVSGTYAPTIMNGYSSYSVVPSTYTKVARFEGSAVGSTIETTYAAYISNTQPAGTYVGQVKYALVHPSTSSTSTYIMQNVADWESELLPDEQVVAVDNRDGQSYTVSKLCVEKDSNGDCTKSQIWMTQNLDLLIGGTYNGEPIVLTSENTDLNEYDTNGDGTGTTFAGYSTSTVGDSTVITWTPTGSTMTGTPATITNFASGNPANSVSGWTNDNYTPYMAEGGTTIMRQGTKYTSISDCETTGGFTETECNHYRVGNYYNWTASVAMNSTSSYTTNLTVMPNSICPKGWRLPNGLTSSTGGSTIDTASDFNYLLKAYGITGTGGTNGLDLVGDTNVTWGNDGYSKIGQAPLYFVRSGLVGGSTLYNFSSNGYYWSSTVYNGTSSYYLLYNSSELYPARRSLRSYGWSVRCVARAS